MGDKTRRWSSTTYQGIQVTYDKEADNGDEVIIKHVASNASLIIQRQASGFLITDERGVSVSSENSFYERLQGHEENDTIVSLAARTNDYSTSASATIEHMGIRVEFTQDGQKRVSFSNSNHQIELESPSKKIKVDLPTGRFFQAIHFDNAFLEELARQHPRTFVQIVAAKDMGLEPGLKAFNGLATFEAAIKLQSAFDQVVGDNWEGPEAWNPINFQKLGGLTAVEKPWRDTAEFEGYKAAIPTLFSIVKRDDGFDLRTSSAGKERILSRGCIFAHAANHTAAAHSLTTAKLDAVIQLLENADTITDRGQKKWHFVVIDHQGNFEAMRALSESADEQYNMNHHEFAVLNITPHLSIVAIQQTNLERVLCGQPVNSQPEGQAPIQKPGDQTQLTI